jgi:hypothetical protein
MSKLGKGNLSSKQVDILIDKHDSKKRPLFLVLLAVEASNLSLFESVDNDLDKLPKSLKKLWIGKESDLGEGPPDPRSVIPRLQSKYGKALVDLVFVQVLSAARTGMTEDALLRVIKNKTLKEKEKIAASSGILLDTQTTTTTSSSSSSSPPWVSKEAERRLEEKLEEKLKGLFTTVHGYLEPGMPSRSSLGFHSAELVKFTKQVSAPDVGGFRV